jgi:GNAT superfamily N-acetyltransferase
LAGAASLRGRGFGATLMRHAESELAALGCPKVNLQIMAFKTELRGFYEKLGYRMDEVVSLGKRL